MIWLLSILLLSTTRSTAALITVHVSTSISVATTIPYSEDLLDTSSAEYATQSHNIRVIFQSDIEAVARDTGMTLNSVTIEFTKKTSRRKRRSTSTDTTITAVYSVSESASTDLTALADTVSGSTSSAVVSAISNSSGTYMSTSAIASVSSSAVDASATTTSSPRILIVVDPPVMLDVSGKLCRKVIKEFF